MCIAARDRAALHKSRARGPARDAEIYTLFSRVAGLVIPIDGFSPIRDTRLPRASGDTTLRDTTVKADFVFDIFFGFYFKRGFFSRQERTVRNYTLINLRACS